MLFNGIDLEPYFRIKDIRGRGLIKRRINSVSVPGMDGEHPTSIETPAKLLEVDIRIISKNLRETVDELNGILATDGPAPIIFPDEPDMTYYGTVEDTVETGEKVHLGRHDTTIYIRRSDPKKYGKEKEETFANDVLEITNEGTDFADPIFELEVLAPITYVMIQNQNDDYMMIGRPINVDDMPYSRLETILNDTCSSLVGWTALPNGTQLDTGIVGGVMEVQNGHSFSSANYGTNPNGWVGPAIKRSLSEPLQDFSVEIRIGTFNTHGEVGSLELHLLDETNNVVAILAMRDSIAGGVSENRAVIQLGQAGNRHQYVNYNGGYQATWNDFSGIIRLEREGTEFRAHVAVIEEDGRHNRRYTPPVFNDSLGAYQGKVAQVLVYDAKAKEYSTYDKLMNNIHISKINQEVGVPYIADVGDNIQFNHVEKMIYINGEPRPDLKDFGGSFFHLAKGENQLVVHPSEAFRTSVRYRERYR